MCLANPAVVSCQEKLRQKGKEYVLSIKYIWLLLRF